MNEVKDLCLVQNDRFSGKHANNKELYIVVTEESGYTLNVTGKSAKSTPSSKLRIYLAVRADETQATIKISGYDVTANSELDAQLKEVKTYNDALDIAKNGNLELEILTFPWHRIVRIKQLRYNLIK